MSSEIPSEMTSTEEAEDALHNYYIQTSAALAATRNPPVSQ